MQNVKLCYSALQNLEVGVTFSQDCKPFDMGFKAVTNALAQWLAGGLRFQGNISYWTSIVPQSPSERSAEGNEADSFALFA